MKSKEPCRVDNLRTDQDGRPILDKPLKELSKPQYLLYRRLFRRYRKTHPPKKRIILPQQADFRIDPDGRPIPDISLTELPPTQRALYKHLAKTYYKHHPNGRKRHRFERQITEHITIEKDPAITRYFTSVKNRPRNKGYLSPETRTKTLSSATNFLKFLELPITESALTELINRKKSNTQDFGIEDKLEEFANLLPLTSYRNYGVTILGIFKANRTRLSTTIDNHYWARTKPISDGILRDLLKHLDERSSQLIQYQAYAGQRIKTVATIPLSQIDISRKNYAIAHVLAQQNKTRQEHDFIIPNKLIEKILTRCKQLHLDTPFPNYEQLWKEITKFAAEKYGIRLTSHYLRKRFATIASDTPMDVNQWEYLMGSKKSKGHDASVYNLNFIDEKLIPNYDRYLAQKLALDTDEQTQQELNNVQNKTGNDEQDSIISHLQKTIDQQTKQIERLTNLIEMKLSNQ